MIYIYVNLWVLYVCIIIFAFILLLYLYVYLFNHKIQIHHMYIHTVCCIVYSVFSKVYPWLNMSALIKSRSQLRE